MTNQTTFIPAQFNQEELDEAIYQALYGIDRFAMIHVFQVADLLNAHDEQAAMGRTRDLSYIPFAVGNLFETFVRYHKSPAEIAILEAEAKEQATAQYHAHLAEQESLAIEALVAQITRQAAEKEAQVEADKIVSAREAALVQAQGVIDQAKAQHEAAKVKAAKKVKAAA